MADFFTELRERRVIPALGVYVASCWVVIEILDRLVVRYQLSASVTDLVFWGLYSLLPAAALFAWSYGRPGKDKATKAQKIGVPINLVLTAGLLTALYLGKGSGPDSEADAVVAEATPPVTEEPDPVAESVQRERLAVFFYENESDDPDLPHSSLG